MYLRRFRTSTLMALVLYAAIDFAALFAVFAWDSILGVSAFLFLTAIVPLLAATWWLVTHIDRNTLY